MNYSNMTTAALQPASGSISLPPISSIEFQSQIAHHRSSPEVVQPLPPPPPTAPRVLPPLPYPPYGARPAMVPPPPPPPVPHGYIDTRPLYPGLPTAYQPMPGRMPLPSSADPSLIVHPPRHKAKEVKRRTKTGCLTCRKRRIKVSWSDFYFLSSGCPGPSVATAGGFSYFLSTTPGIDDRQSTMCWRSRKFHAGVVQERE